MALFLNFWLMMFPSVNPARDSVLAEIQQLGGQAHLERTMRTLKNNIGARMLNGFPGVAWLCGGRILELAIRSKRGEFREGPWAAALWDRWANQISSWDLPFGEGIA